LLEVPLDIKDLRQFTRPDDAVQGDEDYDRYESSPELTCYQNGDRASGLYWELWVHTLVAEPPVMLADD
jgi:hypothetical protein